MFSGDVFKILLIFILDLLFVCQVLLNNVGMNISNV